jgi:hypothetical protein
MKNRNYALREGELPHRLVTRCGTEHYTNIDIWEYKLVELPVAGGAFLDSLNELGLQGWEAVEFKDREENVSLAYTRVYREVLLKRRMTKDMAGIAEWSELQSRMIAREALRGDLIEDEILSPEVGPL